MNLKLMMKVAGLLTIAGLSQVSNAASCSAGTKALGMIDNKQACELSGTYTSDLLLTSDILWVLKGGVYIGQDNKNSAKISIQAGTKIVGQGGADFLVINRGSKILANGTKDAPIVFTSAKLTNRKRGDWGGLVINGNAPINVCNGSVGICEAEGEGATGTYGGNNAQDNSGILRYVRVEFAGFQITPTNELNGIAFQGVGSQTVVDYVQVHMSADDGVEFFGGSVNAKHVVLSGNDDDGFDWTSGYNGKAQFVLIKQHDDTGNNGIEADNLEANHSASPRSMPELSNFTMIGSLKSPTGQHGVLLRRGTGAKIQNFIVTNFKSDNFDLDDAETFRAAKDQGTISVTSSIFDTGKTFGVKATDAWDYSKWVLGQGNLVTNPELIGFIPAQTSLALGAGVTPDDLFFDEVDFMGAVKNDQEDWTQGWITSELN